MRATIDNSDQSGSEIVQLVVGWTVISSSIFLFIFNALAALPVLFIGGCILAPYYSSRMAFDQSDELMKDRMPQRKTTSSSESRLEKALVYKELFREGIISEEEYADTVGRLFPELEREAVGQKQYVSGN